MQQQKDKHGVLTWLLLIFIPIVGIIVMWVKRKDYSKKKKIILTIIFSFWTIILLACSGSDSETTTTDNVIVEEKQSESENTAEETDKDQVNESKKQEETDDEYPNDVNGINITFSKSVRNDTTGRWRLAKVADTTAIEDYALDYYKSFFKDDSEVHIIINYTLGTTSVMNAFDGMIYLDVHEYVDKEEHDASVLAGGMLLISYTINIETGEVEEVKDDDEFEPTAEKITQEETAQNNTGSSDNSDNFNTYDNDSQQQTDDTYVLNTSTMKIHLPSCSSVKKIAPNNYSTTNDSIDELISQGYSTCGICFK